MLDIEQPAMAINYEEKDKNGKDKFWHFDMSYTQNVPKDGNIPVSWLINAVKVFANQEEEKKLKNLVITCHGSPGRLYIGNEGFSQNNVHLFTQIAGFVERIWIVACNPAAVDATCTPGVFCGADGDAFISSMSRNAKCVVAAPIEVQINRVKTYPFGKIPMFEGTLNFYKPDGTKFPFLLPSGFGGE
jgi:hypothetical protein